MLLRFCIVIILAFASYAKSFFFNAVLSIFYLCVFIAYFSSIILFYQYTKVCLEKKFTHICMYYANSGRASVKSLRSAKSRHPEDSKLVRQVLIIQKILPENVIEQKKFFCENTIFVKK